MVACATPVPTLDGVYSDLAPSPAHGSLDYRDAILAIGDPGRVSQTRDGIWAEALQRFEGADSVVLLGDVFYAEGLLGLCPADGAESKRGCENPGPPEAQRDAVLGKYRRALPGATILAIAGNHDIAGDPLSTQNACRLIQNDSHSGAHYVGRGCQLTRRRPIAVHAVGPTVPCAEGATDKGTCRLLGMEMEVHPRAVIVIVDSEWMIHDEHFRRASERALHAELERIAERHPNAWRIVASHHPLESYGAHNGAGLVRGLHKDLYPLLTTVLGILYWPVSELSTRGHSQQDVYSFGYRAFRRALYRALDGAGADVILSGHDHSLQLIEIERPGARYQVVSGAGARKTPVQRFGLDLLWTNRLARLVGLGTALPAPRHRLRFAAGDDADPDRSGYGYAVLLPGDEMLRLEYWDLLGREPIAAVEISR